MRRPDILRGMFCFLFPSHLAVKEKQNGLSGEQQNHFDKAHVHGKITSGQVKYSHRCDEKLRRKMGVEHYWYTHTGTFIDNQFVTFCLVFQMIGLKNKGFEGYNMWYCVKSTLLEE